TRPSDDEGPLDILEFDWKRRALSRTGRADSPRAWYWGSPLHDRFIDADRERRIWTLRDGRSGAALATLRDGGPLTYAATTVLSDGRWVLLLADDSGAWLEVFSPAGERLSRIPIGPKGLLRAGGEVAPGKLAVALAAAQGTRAAGANRFLCVVDLDLATATRVADGLRPVYFWRASEIRPGSEATKLYLEGSKTLIRFDPATGDRRILLRRE
ncbi:MAG: hypothetical protein M3R62_05495, partial [Acidobacteriota bacterium]|nr:hypothetical protein [Acidobacteriota bacterium]